MSDIKTGYVINQVCGSGLRSIVAGYQSILSGDAKIVIAGGQESMTNSNEKMMLKDGLIDAYNNYHMGITAENVAEKWNISREDQDNFATTSQSKAQEAIKNKKFKDEIIDGLLLEDEHPRKDVTIETLSKLKPAFKENGTVTAGNSSGINDGAAAVLLMKREEAERRNLKTLAKIVSWATCGVDPALMGSGPIPASKKALDKISFDLKESQIIGLLGPNGAGKTTLMKILSGSILDWEGTIKYKGFSLPKDINKFKQKIGYLPENNPLYKEMYVKEYLQFSKQFYKGNGFTIEDLIHKTGLEKCKKQKIKELSKGYRQRVGIAASIFHNPDILFLDEPSSSLDPSATLIIENLVKQVTKQKVKVIMTTHDIIQAKRLANEILYFDNGRLLEQGSSNEILNNPKSLTSAYYLQ